MRKSIDAVSACQTNAQIQREIAQVRVDLRQTEANLRTAVHRQTVWIIVAIGAVATAVSIVDRLLA